MWVPVSKGGSRSQQRTMDKIDENLQKNTQIPPKTLFKRLQNQNSHMKYFHNTVNIYR